MSVIDLEYLASISDNDREFEAELLGVYIEDGEQHLNLANVAIAKQDWESLAREAHHLKGASSNVGALGLQALALDLENNAKAQNLDQARAILDRMLEQYQQVKDLFQERYGG